MELWDLIRRINGDARAASHKHHFFPLYFFLFTVRKTHTCIVHIKLGVPYDMNKLKQRQSNVMYQML
jgi:hypothetical protein